MTTCGMGPETAERYVSGLLSESEQAAFEEHYFACDSCLRLVQTLQAAQVSLQESDQPASGATSATSDRPRRRSLPYAWLAVAATLVLSVAIWRLPQEREPATEARPGPAAVPQTSEQRTTAPAQIDPVAERLAQMGAVTAPPYISLTTRSQEDLEARGFEDAMAAYSAARYGDAAARLRAIAARSPRASHVLFFLGISELMQGDAAAARTALERTIALEEPPYADEAHFYLAKAALQERNLEAARRELRMAVKLEAGPAGEAARLLGGLDAIDAGRSGK